jgi:hypothetical protein
MTTSNAAWLPPMIAVIKELVGFPAPRSRAGIKTETSP